MPPSRRRYLYLLLAAVLFAAAGWRVAALADFRAEHRLGARAATGVPPAYALADGLLGGFRGYFIAMLWQRADAMKKAGRYYEMFDLYKTIAALEPNFPNTWAYMAWDLAYGVATSFADDPRERVYWVFRGIALLRDAGIRQNPRAAALYEALAWTLFDKIVRTDDAAYPLYRRHLAQEMTAILGGGGEPALLEAIERAEQTAGEKSAALGETRDRAAKISPDDATLPQDAALLNMGQQLREKFNLDVATMLELDRTFAPLDWRLAAAHSLYWAWLGNKEIMAGDPSYAGTKYVRMIYLALIQLAYQGDAIVSDGGLVIAAPQPAMTDSIIKYFTELLADDRRAGNGGMRMAFENFLLTTAFNYYLADDLLNAERARQKLAQFSGDEKRYGGNMAAFWRRELPTLLSALDDRARLAVAVSFCRRAYGYLIAGDAAKFQEQMAWFDGNYARLSRDEEARQREAFSGGAATLPAADDLKAELAAQILRGDGGYSTSEISRFRRGLQQYLPSVLARAEK
ncbi:hypothetical protein AGMMS49959_14900 [Planctomycetales bacterium]|nr:hypothetical protein AGMMS49959_14900 [Planctomycetales bacterium]